MFATEERSGGARPPKPHARRYDELKAESVEALREILSGDPEDVLAVLRVAAAGGAIEAQLRLGQALLDGYGGEARPDEALHWFGRAATSNDPMGMNMVGRCVENGWGIAADPTLAARWYRAAGDRGCVWGLYNLATLLTLGAGVPKNRAEALSLFRQAARAGHAKSMNMIGSFYEDGWAVERDPAVALKHYRSAAAGGDFRGQFNVARVLIETGALNEGMAWLAQVPAMAPPRFISQVRAWIRANGNPQVRGYCLDETRRVGAEMVADDVQRC